MKKYLVCYCVYDPDDYQGHRMTRLEAESLDAAKEQAKKWLETSYPWIAVEFEYIVFEYIEDTGYAIHDLRKRNK